VTKMCSRALISSGTLMAAVTASGWCRVCRLLPAFLAGNINAAQSMSF